MLLQSLRIDLLQVDLLASGLSLRIKSSNINKFFFLLLVSRVVLPQPDFPTITLLIDLGSNGLLPRKFLLSRHEISLITQTKKNYIVSNVKQNLYKRPYRSNDEKR